MSLLNALPNINSKIKEIISDKELTEFFKMLNELSYWRREYMANENRLDIWLLDESFHGCQITISNVLGSSRIEIKPFYLADNGPSTTYTFDSLYFSKAMDTHLLTPKELMSKQQLVSEKKQEESRQKALKDAHGVNECVPSTCEFCIFDEEKRKKLEQAKFLEEQEQERKKALKYAHYSTPQTCVPNTCKYCINEQIRKYEDEKFAHEAKMSSACGPYWRQLSGGGQGYT